jgi:hypothetical protein
MSNRYAHRILTNAHHVNDVTSIASAAPIVTTSSAHTTAAPRPRNLKRRNRARRTAPLAVVVGTATRPRPTRRLARIPARRVVGICILEEEEGGEVREACMVGGR